MSRHCPLCFRMMDLASSRGAVHTSHYVCPGCGLEWIYGIHKLPDPEDLRREAEQLERIADDIESNDGLAGRLREALHA